MKGLLIQTEVKMTSQEIAQLTGKQHKNIMRDIRKEIEAIGDELISEPVFCETTYLDAYDREQPQYTFGRKGAMQLALKYDAKTRFKVIERLEELEATKYRMPNHPEALRLYADQLEQNIILLADNQEMKPKAEQYDTFLSVKDNVTMNEAAKAIGIGRNKLFKYLRDKKILMKNNIPYQKYIDQDYFTIRHITIKHSDWENIKTQTLATPKGIDYIAKQLRKDEMI